MTTEPSARADEVARCVIGAAIEVHRALGPGFIESVYEEALAAELRLVGVGFTRQAVVELAYKGAKIGEHRLDLLVEGCLVVELKAVDRLLDIHAAQLRSYLRAAGLQLGLLINFNATELRHGLKRVVTST